MGDKEPGFFAGLPMIADETSSLSLMGDFLGDAHGGGRRRRPATPGRSANLHCGDTYGGLFGTRPRKGSWDGSKQLAEPRLRAEHGQRVARAGPLDRGDRPKGGCFGWWVAAWSVCTGPDVPAGPSAGSDPPEPMKWQKMPRIDGGNLTGWFGAYDANLKKQAFSVEEVREYLDPPKRRRRPCPGPAASRPARCGRDGADRRRSVGAAAGRTWHQPRGDALLAVVGNDAGARDGVAPRLARGSRKGGSPS